MLIEQYKTVGTLLVDETGQGLNKMARLLLLNVVVILLTTMSVGHAHADNASCIAMFQPLFDNDDFRGLSKAFNNRPENDLCSSVLLDQLRQRATIKVSRVADHLQSNENDSNAAFEWLTGGREATFTMTSVWQVNAVFGDIASQKEDWPEASMQYGTAYEMSLGSATQSMNQRKAASAETQERLYLLAAEAMQLAGGYGEIISRSGDASGIYSTRGIKPKFKPTPLKFEYDSATLTPQSLNEVSKIVAYLIKAQHQTLEVIGHTDWEGPDSYNQGLSERRAVAVANEIGRGFLSANGSPLSVSTRGAGETCPPVVSDMGRYTEAELAALYRRVSLRWPTTSNSTLRECDESGIRR